MGVRDNSFAEFIGSVAFEDDGGWSKEVWDAAWQARQQEIDVLQARIKLLESEVAWAENGYTQPKE
jgi:hypothetical protein